MNLLNCRRWLANSKTAANWRNLGLHEVVLTDEDSWNGLWRLKHFAIVGSRMTGLNPERCSVVGPVERNQTAQNRFRLLVLGHLGSELETRIYPFRLGAIDPPCCAI